jgi:predicted glycosyltransferase involved in capsule biosynthesis
MKDDLIKHIKAKKFDYNKIKEDNIVIVQNPEELYDINFMITARGRREFSEPMYRSFLAAAEKSPLNITYTVVEHSDNPEHSKFCKNNKINYIWIKPEEEKLFNKCLSYNMGAFFGPKSKYLLFHDIDCLVQSDFFLKLFDNILHKQCRAIQCFTGRRVLYINEQFTPKVTSGEFSVDDLSLDMSEVDLPRLGGKVMIGAPGGSIMVERELFFEVGGYDAKLFLANSPEDAFFWEKVDTVDKMHVSDDPDIELYHMYHPPTWMNNPYVNEMQTINNSFKAMSTEDKKEIIQLKSDMIKEYK